MKKRICNFCILRDCKALAQKRNCVITIEPAPNKSFPAGVNLYMSKPGELDRNFDWVVWLASVPTSCHCHEGEAQHA